MPPFNKLYGCVARVVNPAMGKGFLDYKTFINTLKEIGYQGYIAYEMYEVLDFSEEIRKRHRDPQREQKGNICTQLFGNQCILCGTPCELLIIYIL
jgi:hypothetical protein